MRSRMLISRKLKCKTRNMDTNVDSKRIDKKNNVILKPWFYNKSNACAEYNKYTYKFVFFLIGFSFYGFPGKNIKVEIFQETDISIWFQGGQTLEMCGAVGKISTLLWASVLVLPTGWNGVAFLENSFKKVFYIVFFYKLVWQFGTQTDKKHAIRLLFKHFWHIYFVGDIARAQRWNHFTIFWSCKKNSGKKFEATKLEGVGVRP